MSKLCQAKEGKLADILLVYKVTAENLAKEIEQGEEKMDATEEKLEAMTQLCQSQDKRLEDAAELRRMLETVLQQRIKQEESQQLAMERVEEEFERRMSESQRALKEERAEAASLRKKMLAQQETSSQEERETPMGKDGIRCPQSSVGVAVMPGGPEPKEWAEETKEGRGTRDHALMIEWAQHWRAEYNPYRTVKGAF
ncbi:hypothetical protein SKAU_G00282750 [Synaphobranchus kaupii]|uniref:Uncharacterized protein n=1 Tax=Synaphobranchus kaupii TaxID=118154 RepID=A0A9Q1EXM3_SYNKA|nr:hypothetical protein SKAU_G00282750 [Synaphobranchus kaupii]